MIEEDKNKDKKESFFKAVIKSIKSFEKYEDFGLEGIGKTIKYLLKIVAIFTLVISIMSVYKFSKSLNESLSYFDKNIESLTYENDILQVNNNEKLEIISDKNIKGKIIIDTSDLTEEQVNQYRENIKNEKNGILLLKDRVILKNEMLSTISETSYKSFFEKYNINTSLDKQKILNYFNNNIVQIYFSIFITLYLYMFAVYFASILVDAVVLGALGYITARLIGMKIKYSPAFSMGVHALTLPIILNIFYVILNGFTGYIIKYFQFMYTAISYIYVITAILIIRSDYIKRQTEVEKIKSEQEKVRQELEEKQQKEDEDKAKQKDKRERQKQKEEDEEKRNKVDTPDIGEKPEGSNV